MSDGFQRTVCGGLFVCVGSVAASGHAAEVCSNFGCVPIKDYHLVATSTGISDYTAAKLEGFFAIPSAYLLEEALSKGSPAEKFRIFSKLKHGD